MTQSIDQTSYARGTVSTHIARSLTADTISVVLLDVLNFAMAHNSVPLVRELALTNRSDSTWSKVVVHVELQGFAEPWQGQIQTLDPGATYRFEDLPLRYDVGALLNVTERDHAILMIRVATAADGATHRVAQHQQPVSILAYNEWSRVSEPQMLASFVLPNHPHVQRLLSAARAHLERHGHTQGFCGYQPKDPAAARVQARSLYEALVDWNITYANPPASFEKSGQKIRTPEQVKSDQLATCLDISTLLAGAMEQAGLHPLIILVEGHAFLGVWLRDDYRGDALFIDAATLRNEVHLGNIEVFDSSAAVAQPHVPFEEAIIKSRSQLVDDETFRVGLCVRGARAQRYLPLPSRVYARDFQPLESPAPAVTHSAAAETAPAHAWNPSSAPETTPAKLPQQSKARIRHWQNQLLDLSLRNRLLNFSSAGSRQGIHVRFDDLARLEDALAEGRAFTFQGDTAVFSEQDARSAKLRREVTGEAADLDYILERFDNDVLHSTLSEEAHNTALTKLSRKAKESFEESGAHSLFLTLGLLQWFEAPSSEVPRYAPLVLVPVQLMQKSIREPWRLQAADEGPVFNPSLIEKLRVDFGVDLTSLNSELPTDEYGADLPLIFATVRTAIRGIARWEVKEEAHVGHFSFAKHAMWLDTNNLLETLDQRPLLACLAEKGAKPFPTGSGIPKEPELDANFPPQTVFCPLDADASQLAAILAAAGGESYVLQGPPGTGKSQTITNLITHALSENKTVLFVSAKMAALSVVHRRLQRTGVGPFCLELHSHAANKRAVLDEFAQALNTVVPDSPIDETWAAEASDLAGDITRLNDYTNALHRVRPQGMRLYDGIANLCRLRDVPRIKAQFIPEQQSRADREKRIAVLKELTALLQRLGPPHQHGLSPVRRSTWSPAAQDSIITDLDAALRTCTTLGSQLESLSSLLAQDIGKAPFSDILRLLKTVNQLQQSSRAERALLSATDPAAAKASALRYLNAAQTRDELRKRLDEQYTDALFELDLDNLATQLRTWGTAFFLIAFFMLWRTRALLRSVRKVATSVNNPILLADVEDARKVRKLSEECDTYAPNVTWLTPDLGDTPDWTQLKETTERAAQLREALDVIDGSVAIGGDTTKQRLARWASKQAVPDPALFEQALRTANELNDGLTRLAQFCEFSPDYPLARLTSPNDQCVLNVVELEQHLVTLISGAPQLRDWTLYQAKRVALASLPEATFLQSIEAQTLPVVQLVDAFERAYDQTWVSYEYENDPALAQFDSAAHQTIVEHFKSHDAQFGELIAKQAGRQLSARVPRGADGEMAVLYRELKKQRKHLPIRQLFQRTSNVRSRLKPCLLMSPLSVAQYLSPEDQFDLVIFDEASQLPTADAIGSIGRAKQVIVVGDSKQLPPTTFFARAVDDDDGELSESSDELESVLDECIASGLQELSLRWHYRSQHEHLIAFSNSHYYDGKLLTFASADDCGGKLGVNYHFISQGYYDKGKSRTHRAEAEALVAEVVRRLTDPIERTRSLGVVTFSQAQQVLVEDLLDAARRRNPAIEPYFGSAVFEPVFVKNLENVQGDERDVILFSIGYGPDEHGRVYMNFGPLNNQGGERRLNVAITRARQQNVVFTSLRADMIDLRKTRALGVKHLRRFLDFAERGPAAIAEAVDVSHDVRFDSPFEEQVYKALTERGYEVMTQVGCSGYRIDLAVVDPENPGRFLLGIECDGAAYHSAKTARDRDRLRESVLKSLGWTLARIWSTDWWTQPQMVLDRLDKLLAKARASSGQAMLRGSNARVNAEPSPSESDNSLEAPTSGDSNAASRSTDARLTPEPPTVTVVAAPYVITQFATREQGVLDDVRHTSVLIADLSSVIRTESPVHLKVIAARLSPRWDYTRVTKRVLTHLERVITTHQLGHIAEDFVWKAPDDRAQLRTFRAQSTGEERKLEEIAIEEFQAAALAILRQSVSVPHSELTRLVSRTLGLSRAGNRVSQRVNLAITLLQGTGLILTRNDSWTLP